MTEEAFEVKYTGRRLPYTTEGPPTGLRLSPRLRPVTQITISAPHTNTYRRLGVSCHTAIHPSCVSVSPMIIAVDMTVATVCAIFDFIVPTSVKWLNYRC